jgi:hypothetical protein
MIPLTQETLAAAVELLLKKEGKKVNAEERILLAIMPQTSGRGTPAFNYWSRLWPLDI